MVDTPINGNGPVAPDIATVLNAFAIVANRVSSQVTLDAKTSAEEAALLHALAASVQAIGSEYQRVVMSQAVAAGQQQIVGPGGLL